MPTPVRAGNLHRGVIRAPAGYMPRVTIEASLFLIPSPGQVDFREELRSIIQSSVSEALQTNAIFNSLDATNRTQTLQECTIETLTLTEYRLSYIGVVGALDNDFGGCLRHVSPVAIHISKAFAIFIQSMHSTSPSTKKKYLQRLCPAQCPPGARQWMDEKFRGITRFMTCQAPQIRGWYAAPKQPVRQWVHLAVGSDINNIEGSA